MRTTEEVKALAKDIRESFGGAYILNLAQVGQVIGAKSRNTARLWASTLVPRNTNGRKGYLVLDVARKIMEQ